MFVRSRAQEAALDQLERRAFTYFLHEIDTKTGLVRDNTRRSAPASIAGTGFALTAYVVGAERGYVTRTQAVAYARRALAFLWNAPESDDRGATCSRGFFYHFLALRNGRRVWSCELSTIDTAIAIAGVLAARQYFDRGTPAEQEVRRLGDAIYRRVDWAWATAGGRTVCNGWLPESGFLPYRWQGYSEGLLLYLLGLGSPTHPLSADSYAAWTETYEWRSLYGHEYVYAGPLFIHHLTQCWIDLRGVQDAYLRGRGIDYFENSRRATYVHQAYAVHDPHDWAGYSAANWGLTASDGPGPATHVFRGKRRAFFGYAARGAPFGPDDGTLSPWCVAASLPFAPEIVLPTLAAIDATFPESKHSYGYTSSFNPSFPSRRRATVPGTRRRARWTSPAHYAINQGPVVLMVENYRTGLLWDLMRSCPYVVAGLRRAGFEGGWLAHAPGAARVTPSAPDPRPARS